MISGRRDRNRSLIRSKARTAAISTTLSPIDGVATYQRGVTYDKDARSASPSKMSSSQPELISYLRQLTTLHAAGILNDEEFFAARGRLLGS